MLNNELNKYAEINVVNNDVQYQEGIFEILEINKEIDFIIISQLLPGEFEIETLIEKIENINSNIKIILILEKYDENLEKVLVKKGVYRIFYDNEIKIQDVIKIINDDKKMEKYNEEIRKEIEELKEYIKNRDNSNYEPKNKIKNNNKKIYSNKKTKEEKYLLYILKNKIINGINNTLNNKLSNQFNKKTNYNYNTINNQIKIINKNSIIEKILKINLINNSENNYKNNEKIKSENNKIISVLGNSGAGKSVFSAMLANSLKKYCKKILIIDFDILNNSLHTILGVKKYSDEIKRILQKNNYNNDEIKIENLIINVNKKIDLISGINLLFNSNNKIDNKKMKNIINKISDFYDVVIIDTTSECFFEYTQEIINMSEKCIYLTEANLVEISKSKRLLEMYYTNWNIEKNKINIIFNKFNKNSIDINLLKILYSDYNILGKIKLKNNYNEIINSKIKKFNLKNKILNNYKIFNKIIANTTNN